MSDKESLIAMILARTVGPANPTVTRQTPLCPEWEYKREALHKGLQRTNAETLWLLDDILSQCVRS